MCLKLRKLQFWDKKFSTWHVVQKESGDWSLVMVRELVVLPAQEVKGWLITIGYV